MIDGLTPRVVLAALVIVWSAVLFLVIGTGVAHGTRVLVERRRARHDELARPWVTAYALGDGEDAPRLRAASGVLGDRVDERLLALLDVVSGDARARLVAMLVDRGHPPRLRRRMRSGWAAIRAGSVRRLGMLALPADERLLLDALTDRSSVVRSVAARALCAYPSRRAVQAVLDLVRSDGHVPSLVLVNVLMALGREDQECRDAIREGLLDSSERVRAACAQTLGLLTSVIDSPRLGILLNRDPAPVVQLAAATALTRIATGNSVPALLAGTTSSWPQVRVECVRALQALPSALAGTALAEVRQAQDPVLATVLAPAALGAGVDRG